MSCSARSSPVPLALPTAAQDPHQYAQQQDSHGGGSSQSAADDQGPPWHNGSSRDDNGLLLRDELDIRLPLAPHHARGQNCGVCGVRVNRDVIYGTER